MQISSIAKVKSKVLSVLFLESLFLTDFDCTSSSYPQKVVVMLSIDLSDILFSFEQTLLWIVLVGVWE